MVGNLREKRWMYDNPLQLYHSESSTNAILDARVTQNRELEDVLGIERASHPPRHNLVLSIQYSPNQLMIHL